MAEDKTAEEIQKSLKSMTDMLLKDSDKKTSLEQSAEEKRAKGISDSIASWATSNEKSLEKIMQNDSNNMVNSSSIIVSNLNELMEEQGKNQGEIFDELAGMHISLADGFAKQFNFDAKRWAAEKERLAELDRKTSGELGVDATDKSFDFGVIGTVAGIAGLVTGFLEGFFGPMGTLWKAMKGGANKFFKAIKWSLTPVGKVYNSIKSWFNTKISLGWTKFADLVKNSKIGGWYTSVKNWFAHKAWDGKLKWAQFKDLLKNSKIGGWYTSLKSYFTSAQRAADGKFAPSKWTTFKKLFTDSKIAGWIKSVKAWFQGGLGKGAILTKVSTLWANSELGKDIAKIGNLFRGGGIKAPAWLTTIKDAFGKGGSFSWLRTIGRILGRVFFFAQIIMGVFDFWTGFEATEGNLFEKVIGGLKAAIKGFFGGFLDLGIMIEDGFKWIITKVAGFFGFDEESIAATMADFSLFGPLKDGLFAVVDWLGLLLTNPLAAFEGLFKGYATVGKWIYDTALKPAWDWFEGMFPDAAATIKPFFVGIADVGTWIYEKALKPFWDWFKLVFSDPMAALDQIVSVMTGFGTYLWDNAIQPVWDWIKSIWAWGVDDEGKSGGWSLSTFIDTAWTKVKEWFVALFAWGKTVPGVSWVLTKAEEIWESVKGWFTGLLSWASTEDEGDSWVVKTVKSVITSVKDWFKKLFKFDSLGDVMKSYFNLLTFFPNMVKDVVLSVTSWLLDLFGFGEQAKAVANAKNFSLGDMLFDAIDAIWEWFKGLLNIDVMGIVKKIPGASTLLSLFEADDTDKAKESLKGLGITQSKLWDRGKWDIADNMDDIMKATKNMKASEIQKLMGTITSLGAADELVAEDTEKVMNELGILMRERMALEAKQGGSGVTVIDSSTTVSQATKPVVIPKSEVTPGNENHLPGTD